MLSNTNTDVDKLITFGQMALEQGWHDQARKHFEQALALDASNREAIQGLERVDKALEHKAFFDSLETQPVKPAKPIDAQQGKAGAAKSERRWLVGVGLAITMVVVLLFGMCSSRDSKTSDSKATTRGSFVSIGQEGRLYVEGADHIQVCIDEKTLDEVVHAVAVGDKYRFVELMESGRVFSVPNNTKALILDKGGFLYSEKSKVRILEGLWAGKAGWVPQEWVTR